MRTLLFYTSLLGAVATMAGQNSTVADTPSVGQKYGLRVSADLVKLLRTAVDDNYSGFEVGADFRFSKSFYAAIELGSENKDRFRANLASTTKGNFVKIGADYNAYTNWLDMNNALFAGLRYGLSNFSTTLLGYSIYQTNQVFPSAVRLRPVEHKGLTAHWAELVVGVKTEVLSNFFLTVNLQLKRKITETEPDNFANLFIPGFNRTYDFSNFGVGYGYTISYLIPIFKK